MSTPKQARQYRRKPSTGDRTKNSNGYRVEASWDTRPDRPAVKVTPDKRAARRLAREWSEQGAYVIVQERDRFQWRTLYELDGPALLADRAALEQAAAEREARARKFAAQQARAVELERRRRHRLAAEATTHARTLMSPPAIVRPENRQRARHITGAQR